MRAAPILPVLLLALTLVPAAARGADSPADLIESGHYRRAQALLEPRVAANPRDAEAVRLLSAVRMAFGASKEALDLAERAVAIEPNSGLAHEQLADVVGEMAGEAGGLKALSLARRYHKEVERACDLDSTLADPRWGLMEYYWRAPGIAGGSKDKARAMPEEIGRINAAEGELAAARVALWEKDTSRAEARTEHALAVAPSSYAAHMQAAQLHAARRRWAEAGQQARAASALEPGRASPYAMLAAAQAHARDWPGLDSTLARADAAVPDNAVPRYQAARALLEDGSDLARAEAYLRDYLGREPEGAAPTLAHAHWRLALVHEKQGRKPEAIAELETALRLKPDLDAAKKDLKRLK